MKLFEKGELDDWRWNIKVFTEWKWLKSSHRENNIYVILSWRHQLTVEDPLGQSHHTRLINKITSWWTPHKGLYLLDILYIVFFINLINRANTQSHSLPRTYFTSNSWDFNVKIETYNSVCHTNPNKHFQTKWYTKIHLMLSSCRYHQSSWLVCNFFKFCISHLSQWVCRKASYITRTK